MYRVAIIGCGRISSAHLEGFQALSGRAEVVALCDMNEELREQRQEEYSVPAGFASVQELLDWGEFDIAGVLTPPEVRSDVCFPLMEAKKHLLVEKPFTHSLEEARAIVEKAEECGVTLAVGQNLRWIPPAPQLREGVLAGRIGKVLSLLIVDVGWRSEPKGWRSTTGKLALSVMGVHWLDRIRWMTGLEGESVYTSSLISGLLPSIGEDITSTVIKLETGGVATMVHHWASYSRRINNSVHIDGTEGSVICRGNELTWIDKDNEKTVESFEGDKMSVFMGKSWTEMVDALDEGRAPHHSGRDNLWTVALLEGAYLSAEENRVVKISV